MRSSASSSVKAKEARVFRRSSDALPGSASSPVFGAVAAYVLIALTFSCLFGLLQLLAALGRHGEVHLFVQNPCREYWGDIAPAGEIARSTDGVQSVKNDIRLKSTQ